MSFSLSLTAFVKIVMHACKYPHAAVNGILLSDRSNPDTCSVVDAVPLFHSNLNLVPMLEAALIQVETYCQSKGLAIAGYYQANELLGDNAPDHTASQIFFKIAENCGKSLLVMVDNRLIDRSCNQLPLAYFHSSDNKTLTKLSTESVKVDADCTLDDYLCKLSSLLQCKSYRSLADFDNHLDNIDMDWTNRFVVDELASLV